MPAFDQTVNSVIEPWLVRTFEYSGPSGSPTVVQTDQNTGYPALPCRNYRTTTDRNVALTGKMYRKQFALKIYEWYRRKPPPLRIARGDKTLRKELITDKMDWRRSRPVRVKPKPKRIPEGWLFVGLPTGELKLVSAGRDPRSKTTRFEWIPVLKDELRPVNRKFTRHNTRVPVESKVNDLEFFRQTGWTDGITSTAVSKVHSQPTINQPYPEPGDTNLTGSCQVLGHFRFVPWTEYGFSTDDPFSSVINLPDDRATEDPAALLTRWSEEVSALGRSALRRHYSKIANKKVDLAVALSEGLKTVNMISSAAKRIASSVLSLKKGNVAKAFKGLFPTTPKGVANDYLAWKYGLKPLMSDLSGACEHLVQYVLNAAPYKSNGHAKDHFERTEVTHLGTDDSFGTSGVLVVRKAIIRVKYGSSYGFSDKLKRQAASLGFTNPLNVGWELLPFSFVADWFIPIGDFLSNLSSLHGLTVKESYKTVFIQETYDRYTFLYGHNGVMPTEGPVFPTPGSDRGTSGYHYFVSCFSQMHRQTTYCKRVVIPLPGLPTPEIKNPISRGHLNSAIALFTQLFSK